jgi:apolipoprotein N-acyltransferase
MHRGAGGFLKGLAALLCGAVVPLGFAPVGWLAVPLLALAGFALLLLAAGPRAALLYGFLFGIGQFGAGVSWVYISIHLYGNAGLALSLASMFLLVMYLALFPALMGWLLAKGRITSAGAFLVAAFPAAWTLSEWLRSWLFTGFPWLNLGYSQIDGPLAGLAPVTGVYGVGWAGALSAGLLAWAVHARGRTRLIAPAALLVLWSTAWGLLQVQWTQPAGPLLAATLVQGNIPQDQKWQPDEQAATLQRYLSLTREHLDSDIVVWPETAVPAFYDQMRDSFLEPLRGELRAAGISLLTGIPVLDRTGWDYYNAVISLDRLDRFYYKVHLVPFGEYLPLRRLLESALSFLPVPQADFSAGDIDQPLLHAAGYPVGASICYEIAFGEQLIAALPEAALLVNVSNDAWFGDSLAPHQHLEMARMRALETGRFLLRATNTGISAIIDERGELLVRSRQFETQTIGAAVQPRAGATPYVLWGNGPLVVAALLVLLATLFALRRARRTAG